MLQSLQSKRLWLIGILTIILISCTTIWITSQYKNIYEVKFNGNHLGYVGDPQIIEEWVRNKKESFQTQFPGIEYLTNDDQISILSVRKYNPTIHNITVLDSLSQKIKVQAFGTKIVIDGNPIGIVKNKNVADEILKQFQSKFIPSADKPQLKILSYQPGQKPNEPGNRSVTGVQFVENVELLKVEIDPEQVQPANEIMDRITGIDIEKTIYSVESGDCVSCIAMKFNVSKEVIYNNNPWIKDDLIDIGDELDLTVLRPLLSVKTEELVKETVEVPSTVEVTYDSTLRVGKSKVINNGIPGRKEITYLVTKVNGEVVNEKIQQENDLEKPVPQKVIQGSKVIEGVGTGSFAWPITDPQITSKFGRRWGRLHTGTDMVSDNRNILASDNGKVVYVGYNSGYGNHVIIDHQNGYRTLYAHMSKTKVKKGALLEKGDLIGIMGSTGNSTGVHLHLEIRKGEDQLNPLSYLS